MCRDVAKHLCTVGAALPTFGQLAEGGAASRQLLRYHCEEPTDMLLGVCDCIADAYRMALVNGVEGLEGQKRLIFILDFYFDLVEEHPKPRDDLAYDAMMAYAARAPRVRSSTPGTIFSVGTGSCTRDQDGAPPAHSRALRRDLFPIHMLDVWGTGKWSPVSVFPKRKQAQSLAGP